MNTTFLKNTSGISLLVVVLVLSAMALLLATTAGIIGVDSLQTDMRRNAAFKIFSGADGCMEVAIKKLRDDRNYVGETLPLGDTSCVVTVTGSDTARTVKARASTVSSTTVREIQASVDWATNYQITSWQELTN